jgi:hypothetical protein
MYFYYFFAMNDRSLVRTVVDSLVRTIVDSVRADSLTQRYIAC